MKKSRLRKKCLFWGSGSFKTSFELLVIMSTTFSLATLSNVMFLLSNIKIYCNVQKRLHFDFFKRTWSQDRINFFAIFLPS